MRSDTGRSGDRRLPGRIYDEAAVKKLKRGQGYTEYGLILMLIGLVVIGALTLMGQSLHELWHNITTAMPR
jgi:pilus assembly protein Flp/PilA